MYSLKNEKIMTVTLDGILDEEMDALQKLLAGVKGISIRSPDESAARFARVDCQRTIEFSPDNEKEPALKELLQVLGYKYTGFFAGRKIFGYDYLRKNQITFENVRAKMENLRNYLETNGPKKQK